MTPTRLPTLLAPKLALALAWGAAAWTDTARAADGPEAPPAPTESRLPSAILAAKAKAEQQIAQADSDGRKRRQAAAEACLKALEELRQKTTEAGNPALFSRLVRELTGIREAQDEDAGHGISSLVFEAEVWRSRKQRAEADLAQALDAEDLGKANAATAERNAADARLRWLTRFTEAPGAAPPAQDAVRRAGGKVLWITGHDHIPQLVALARNGTWAIADHPSGQTLGVWDVKPDGTIHLMERAGLEPQWIVAVQADGRLQGSYRRRTTSLGRIIGPIGKVLESGHMTENACRMLGEPPRPKAPPALPAAAAQALAAHAAAQATAASARAAAVRAALPPLLQALEKEQDAEHPAGIAGLVTRELDRVRRQSDDQCGTQLVLQADRRELDDLRRNAIQSRDFDTANAAAKKIAELDLRLQPAPANDPRFTSACVLVHETPPHAAATSRIFLLEPDGSCRRPGSPQVGTWRFLPGKELYVVHYHTIYRWRMDTLEEWSGKITNDSSSGPLLGSVYGSTGRWQSDLGSDPQPATP